MPRPCTCDKCRVCWLYHHDSRYRQMWEGEQSADPLPPPPPAEKPWPKLAQWLADLYRQPEDKGLGDTLARHFHKWGVSALAEYYERLTGRKCGCKDRQAALNRAFPYTPHK